MSGQSVENRLTQLELRVAELQAALKLKQRSAKDWRKTIGAFTDDAGMQAILKDAMQLREVDRKKNRAKNSTRRKSSR